MREPPTLILPQIPGGVAKRNITTVNQGGLSVPTNGGGGGKNSLISGDGTSHGSLTRTATGRKDSSMPNVRAQKERDLARDIKLVLRTDAWHKLPDLLLDWEVISSRDIIVECGVIC
jgi:hypothetical protein